MEEKFKSALLYNGTIEVKLSKENHRYYINGSPAKVSVSQVQKVLNSEGLNIWRINEALKNVQKNIPVGTMITEELRAAIPVMAKAAPDAKRDEAADEGTEVHERFEQWIKEGREATADKVFPVTEKFILRLHEILKDKPESLHMSVTQFGNWLLENLAHFTFSEQILYSKEYEYPGMADCGLVIKPKNKFVKAVGDFKIRSGVYAETRLQTVAYQHALQEESGEKYDTRFVFLFGRKDGKFTGDFQAIEHEGFKVDFKAFLNCLEINKWLKIQN